jgi:hypothetical protein
MRTQTNEIVFTLLSETTNCGTSGSKSTFVSIVCIITVRRRRAVELRLLADRVHRKSPVASKLNVPQSSGVSQVRPFRWRLCADLAFEDLHGGDKAITATTADTVTHRRTIEDEGRVVCRCVIQGQRCLMSNRQVVVKKGRSSLMCWRIRSVFGSDGMKGVFVDPMTNVL